jgi:hypothetical protein
MTQNWAAYIFLELYNNFKVIDIDDSFKVFEV